MSGTKLHCELSYALLLQLKDVTGVLLGLMTRPVLLNFPGLVGQMQPVRVYQ